MPSDPGMCYRFGYGADVEFVSIDTSLARTLPTEHFFEDERHRQFLEESLAPAVAGTPRWRIPFSHHPAYCAGPHHANTDAMVQTLVPLFRRAGVRIAFAGHEHNFQVGDSAGTSRMSSPVRAGSSANRRRTDSRRRVRARGRHRRTWCWAGSTRSRWR